MILPSQLKMLLLLPLAAAAAAALVVVVDPLHGADSNDGSHAAPLRTIRAAQAAARAALAHPEACGVSVQLGEGRHELPPGGLRLEGRLDSGHRPGCEAVWSGLQVATMCPGGGAVILATVQLARIAEHASDSSDTCCAAGWGRSCRPASALGRPVGAWVRTRELHTGMAAPLAHVGAAHLS